MTDAAAWVRAGSGILFVVTGVLLAWVGRSRRTNVALGVGIVAWGSFFAAFNLFADREDFAFVMIPFAGLWVVGIVCLLVVARDWGRGASRGAWAMAAVATLAPPVSVLAMGPEASARGWIARTEVHPEIWWIECTVFFALTHLFAGLGILASRRLDDGRPHRETLGLALVVVALTCDVAYRAAADLYPPLVFETRTNAVPVLSLVLLTAAWIGASVRTNDRRLARVALVPALAPLAIALLYTLDRIGDGSAVLVGFVRLGGGTLLATAVFGFGVLGPDARAPALRRGTIAAGALAVLFVVAQVAQNFLSAEYGLITGGVVAGAFLFAAQPLQRAFEGRAAPGRAALAAEADASRREDVYRKALRLALRDRRVTREEETHLHELARELGIDGPRAHALLAAVEGERAEP